MKSLCACGKVAQFEDKFLSDNALTPKPKKCVECGTIDASNPYRVFCPKGMGLRSRNDTCILENQKGEVKG
jgi:hypothetical protein